MKLTKNSGRLLGLLFLVSVITGGAGTALRGLSGIDANTVDFLLELIKSSSQMKQAIYLDMFGSALGVAIAIFLYPFIKKFSTRMALAYTGIAFINFTIITLSNVIHISLLTVASEFEMGGGSNPEDYTILSSMLYEAYYWIHFIMLILYAVGGMVLYFFFFKTKLVHQWLAIWGIIASLIVFAGGALQLAAQSVSFLLFLQNGIFVLCFILYLLILGFRPSHCKELSKAV
ncbi:DUF4386 domain-containing protein [Ascidiimonas sp. W6]|uniref:DUF4386 domain-containing protein n=1 Tax=Ascidiimonas meishanensis TaxID=3128903 RepID=UPI0030EF2AE7